MNGPDQGVWVVGSDLQIGAAIGKIIPCAVNIPKVYPVEIDNAANKLRVIPLQEEPHQDNDFLSSSREFRLINFYDAHEGPINGSLKNVAFDHLVKKSDPLASGLLWPFPGRLVKGFLDRRGHDPGQDGGVCQYASVGWRDRPSVASDPCRHGQNGSARSFHGMHTWARTFLVKFGFLVVNLMVQPSYMVPWRRFPHHAASPISPPWYMIGTRDLSLW